jgi:hypothetical protein
MDKIVEVSKQILYGSGSNFVYHLEKTNEKNTNNLLLYSEKIGY